MAGTPEGKVKDAIKKELRKRDIWYFMPMQNGFGVVGIPDFICCYKGRFVAIETKAPGKRGCTTPNQDRTLAEIATHGGWAVVVDDVQQLIDFLEVKDE
jgi:hypothetical protein